VWVVRDGDQELLVPALSWAVLEVDVEAERIVVDPSAATAGGDEDERE
jgi:ribosomal 30S subunit maturation factor RimM